MRNLLEVAAFVVNFGFADPFPNPIEQTTWEYLASAGAINRSTGILICFFDKDQVKNLEKILGRRWEISLRFGDFLNLKQLVEAIFKLLDSVVDYG